MGEWLDSTEQQATKILGDTPDTPSTTLRLTHGAVLASALPLIGIGDVAASGDDPGDTQQQCKS